MAMAVSALFNLSTSFPLRANTRTTTTTLTPCFASFRFGSKGFGQCRFICNASSAAGSSAGNSDNPYEILGVSPIEGFDMIKAAYKRRIKDAESRGDEAYLAKLESAYDTIMMSQLSNRKKGLTVSSFKEEGIEDEGRAIRMGKRLIRSLALVFGCVALDSLGYTGVLNVIEFSGKSIPVSLYNSQELIVTTITAVGLYFMATFYR